VTKELLEGSVRFLFTGTVSTLLSHKLKEVWVVTFQNIVSNATRS